MNDSRFDINSTGYINKTNSISTIGNYNVSVNASDGDEDIIGWVYYSVTNTAPEFTQINFSRTISHSQDILTQINATDADDDSITAYSIKWYVNGTLEPLFNNYSSVVNGNVSLDENYTVSLRAFDSLEWGPWTNSSQLTIGDIDAPNMTGDSISSTSGTNDAPFTLYVNATESNTISFVYVQIEDPNAIKTNYSMTLRNFDKTDPLKYDFAIYRIGQEKIL